MSPLISSPPIGKPPILRSALRFGISGICHIMTIMKHQREGRSAFWRRARAPACAPAGHARRASSANILVMSCVQAIHSPCCTPARRLADASSLLAGQPARAAHVGVPEAKTMRSTLLALPGCANSPPACIATRTQPPHVNHTCPRTMQLRRCAITERCYQ